MRDLSVGNPNNSIEKHDNEEDDHNDDDHNEHHHHHSDDHITHDHNKRSVPTQKSSDELQHKCLNHNFYLKNFAKNGFFTTNEVKNLCPVLLQQIVSRVCTQNNHIDSDHHKHKEEATPQKEKSTSKLTNIERMLYTNELNTTIYLIFVSIVYGYSSLAVLIISLAAILGIFILPVLSKHSYDYVMLCFIGLAFGTLCGDALLHLIPHSLGLHSHKETDDSHNHKDNDLSHGSAVPDYLWYMLCLLGSIYGLFLFEVIINAIYSDDEVRQ